jgi:hypothetical protein
MSQLDRTVQIFFEPLALSFMLNPGKLNGPENPMTVDLFLWMDLDRRQQKLPCSLDLLLKNGILRCNSRVILVQTIDLGTPNSETRNIANTAHP